MTFKTDQELFWRGEFGNAYIERNNNALTIASSIALFSKILNLTKSVSSVIEFGCNIGLNLRALRQLLPNADLCGIEINSRAVNELRRWGRCQVIEDSILEFEIAENYDLSFTKGVLIHINPDYLPVVYQKLYNASRKYILIAEYYNPTPVSIKYRGYSDRLFKRDFAGEMLDQYEGLDLVDYGFVYHRDPNFRQDDITWFLLRKNKG